MHKQRFWISVPPEWHKEVANAPCRVCLGKIACSTACLAMEHLLWKNKGSHRSNANTVAVKRKVEVLSKQRGLLAPNIQIIMNKLSGSGN